MFNIFIVLHCCYRWSMISKVLLFLVVSYCNYVIPGSGIHVGINMDSFSRAL